MHNVITDNKSKYLRITTERNGTITHLCPPLPRDAISRTANVERTGRHKWVNGLPLKKKYNKNENSLGTFREYIDRSDPTVTQNISQT